jgi:gliding motility-associated-like protein
MAKAILFLILLPAFFAWGQNNCFEIKSILVDACGSPEGHNEMVRIEVGSSSLNTVDFQANWPNNPFRGLCQNNNTANNVAFMNSTIQSCGYFLEPQNGVLPAGSQVLLITSEDFDATTHDYSGLMDTIYVIFQCPGNTSGHFANWVNNCDPNTGSRTTTISFGMGCTQTKTYNRCFLTNQNGGIGGGPAIRDGARADFGPNNTVNYLNDGCTIPIGNFFVNANVIAGQLPACPNNAITVFGQVTGISSETEWSSNKGTFSVPTDAQTNYYPQTNQSHYIYFQATDGCGDQQTDSLLITMNTDPDLSVEMNELSQDCGPGSVELIANSSQSVTWNTGETTPQIIPQVEGYFSATVSNSCGTLTDSIYVIFEVDFDYELAFPDTICQYSEGNILTLSITGGNGPFLIEYEVNGSVMTDIFTNDFILPLSSATIGIFTINGLTITDLSSNCSTTINETWSYRVLPSIQLVNIPSGLTFCQGENATVIIQTNATANGFIEYTLTGESISISGTINGAGSFGIPIPTFQTGSLALTLTEGGYYGLDCASNLNETVSIEVSPIPEATLLGDTAVCQYASGIFLSFLIDSDFFPVECIYTINGEGFQFTAQDSLYTMPFSTENAGSFEIQIVSLYVPQTGCSSYAFAPIEITIISPPFIDFLVNPTVLFDDFTSPQFMNFSQGAISYLWDFGDGSYSSESHPSHDYTPDGEQIYTVGLHAANEAGCEDSAFFEIAYIINDLIFVPNSFTPDRNKVNEVFIPVLNGRFDPFNYSFVIFNRWGELVFESKNPTIGWDGTYNGLKVLDGVYVWKLEVGVAYSDYIISKTGHVTLLK